MTEIIIPRGNLEENLRDALTGCNRNDAIQFNCVKMLAWINHSDGKLTRITLE